MTSAPASWDEPETWPLTVDVSDAVPFDGEYELGGWVCVPSWLRTRALDVTEPVVVVSCLAGGTCSTAYWDLAVDGHDGYSMAAHLAAQGMVVVAFDHLGIGASSAVDDLFAVTPSVAGAAQDHAFREVATRLRAGTLAPGLAPVAELFTVGVGHSMGGTILAVQQANHATYDAVAMLGHGGDGLPEYLTPEELAVTGGARSRGELEAAIVELARARFDRQPPPSDRKRPVPGSFLLPDVPANVRRAFIAQQTPLLHSCGLTSMIPGATDAPKAVITAPVFLAFGDQDLTDAYHESLARYSATNDATLYVLAGSAHCHNQAATRAVLWDRMAQWMRSLAG